MLKKEVVSSLMAGKPFVIQKKNGVKSIDIDWMEWEKDLNFMEMPISKRLVHVRTSRLL
jgi:hypothetical protein